MRMLLVGFLLLVSCASASKDCSRQMQEERVLPEERFLVVTPMGGYANRVRALASAFVMARHSHRTLVLDWQSVPGILPAKFRDIFDEPTIALAGKTIFKGKSISKWIRNLETPDTVLSRYYLDEEGHKTEDLIYGRFSDMARDTAPIVHVKTWVDFKPRELNFSRYIAARGDFLRQLSPIEAIQKKVNFVKLAFASPKNMVGVHFRSWKNDPALRWVTPPRLKASSLESYFQQMQLTLDANPATVFFWASDDPVTVEFAQSRFGKERVISSGILKTGRQTKKEIRDAVADWFLLGATDFIIGTYQSSFSDEAALLTSSQRKINIGPSNYSFHSILCFDAEGKAFERPQGEKDPCAPH